MRTLLCASTAALAISGIASAGFVDVAWTGIGVGQMVSITSPGHNGGVFAGQILLTLSNSTGPNYDGNWIAFCTDLYQTVTPGPSQYEYLPVSALPMNAPMGIIREEAINELYATAAGAQFGLDADIAAAFQLAIWEIATDYTGGPSNIGDISSGAFQATGLTGATAFYLNAFLSVIGTSNVNAGLQGLGSELYQDQIIQVGDVPGPGVLATGAIGALLAGSRRRRA